MSAAATFGMYIGTKNGDTRLGPFSNRARQFSSKVWRPPVPVPMSTPARRKSSSTVSTLSAPRSSMKLASDVSLSRSTPSSSTMISLTFSSSCFISIAMGVLNRGVGNGSQHHPAVDDQQLPRNVAGEVGGEKEHGGGDILPLP